MVCDIYGLFPLNKHSVHHGNPFLLITGFEVGNGREENSEAKCGPFQAF